MIIGYVHSGQNLPYPCPFCEKAYTSWGFRRRHIKGYHTSSPELPCKWCFTILPSHQDWAEHVTRRHNLAVGDARNGLLILEEAHMVLQIAQPTRIDSLMELIKNKKDKDEDDPAKESDGKEAEQSQNKDIGEGSKSTYSITKTTHWSVSTCLSITSWLRSHASPSQITIQSSPESPSPSSPNAEISCLSDNGEEKWCEWRFLCVARCSRRMA
ncbi:hypothetical protein E2C01_049336 [Portunus trituberculatus]|uniref:C2H2-type domain-containing protein n=1 Tax=Portunus trituberculatus TaxID=210409 RepID=A0A5B7G645_PORTR|nr:hypothetical protein [Portunus trituberculatus]